MKTPKSPHPSTHGLDRLERLLTHSGRLRHSKRSTPSGDEVALALAGWVRGVAEHAETLESELSELLGHRVDPAELGRLLWLEGRRMPLEACGGNEPVPFTLMQRMLYATKTTQPVVWLLGRMGRSGIDVYEQYTNGTPPGETYVTFNDVKGEWVPRDKGVWQSLQYASPDDKSFQLCIFWYGEETVTVTSGNLKWESEPWRDESGKVVGTKFCQSFEFANLSGKAVTVTISVRGGKEETFIVRVDNPNASDGDDSDLPEPILVPPTPTVPPHGPGPILIPNDFTALPGVDPGTHQQVLDLFARFEARVERSIPRVVRETMTPAQLSQNPGGLDHLMRAAVAALETQ